MAVPAMTDNSEADAALGSAGPGANKVFAGHPLEDVGGALAMLTAMLLAGVAHDDKEHASQPTWHG